MRRFTTPCSLVSCGRQEQEKIEEVNISMGVVWKTGGLSCISPAQRCCRISLGTEKKKPQAHLLVCLRQAGRRTGGASLLRWLDLEDFRGQMDTAGDEFVVKTGGVPC